MEEKNSRRSILEPLWLMRSSFLPRAKSVSYRLLAIQFGLDVVLGSGFVQ